MRSNAPTWNPYMKPSVDNRPPLPFRIFGPIREVVADVPPDRDQFLFVANDVLVEIALPNGVSRRFPQGIDPPGRGGLEPGHEGPQRPRGTSKKGPVRIGCPRRGARPCRGARLCAPTPPRIPSRRIRGSPEPHQPVEVIGHDHHFVHRAFWTNDAGSVPLFGHDPPQRIQAHPPVLHRPEEGFPIPGTEGDEIDSWPRVVVPRQPDRPAMMVFGI